MCALLEIALPVLTSSALDPFPIHTSAAAPHETECSDGHPVGRLVSIFGFGLASGLRDSLRKRGNGRRLFLCGIALRQSRYARYAEIAANVAEAECPPR